MSQPTQRRGLLSRLAAAFLDLDPTRPPAVPREPPKAAGYRRHVPLAEAMGLTGNDPDGALPGNQNQAMFRTLGGAATSHTDFSPAEYGRLLRLCRKAYHLNGVPANLVDLGTDFIVGEGFSLRAEVPENSQTEDGGQAELWAEFGEMLEAFWSDERCGSLEDEHDAQVTTMGLEGQILLPVRHITSAGDILLGAMPNDLLDSVALAPSGQPALALVRDPAGLRDKPLRFFLLNASEPDDTFEPVALPEGDGPPRPGWRVTRTHMDPAEGMPTTSSDTYDGIAFYGTQGRIWGASQGKPELARIVDYANIHDEIVWGYAERMKVLHRYLVHCKWEGLDRDEIEAAAEAAGLASQPDAGEIIHSNEKMNMEAVAPKLNTGAVEGLERTLRMIMAGSLGYPEAFTGSGEDVNRATLVGQNTVTFKRLRRRQKKVVRFYRMIVDFQIRQWRAKGRLPDAEAFPANYEVVRTSLDEKDRTEQTAAIQALAVGLSTLASQGLVPENVASKLAVQVLREFGFTITEDELREGREADETAAQERLAAMQAAMAQAGGKDDDGEGDEGQQGGGPPAPGQQAAA